MTASSSTPKDKQYSVLGNLEQLRGWQNAGCAGLVGDWEDQLPEARVAVERLSLALRPPPCAFALG